MATHYFFPNINVAHTVISKNGCTTSKNYLLALENATLGAAENKSSSELFLGQDIHHHEPLKKYQVQRISKFKQPGALRILVLRNPYSRALSGWINKFLHAQHDQSIIRRYPNEPFSVPTFSSLEQLQVAFLNFASSLATDKNFIVDDQHWSPQHNYYRKLSDYNLILETSQLPELESHLRGHLDQEIIDKVGPLPRFNESKSLLSDLIGTPEAWKNISIAYKKDFLAMKLASLPIQEPTAKPLPDPETLQSLIEREQLIATESREASAKRFEEKEIRVLKQRISAMKNSKSWRYTAWLRWLDSTLTGRPRNRD